jgi:glycosyltransferase involved in cell wall biosynthesis
MDALSNKKVDLSIVIPFLNENDGIQDLLNNLELFCRDFKKQVQVILVDDGSTDGTSGYIGKYKSLSFDLKLIRLSKNFGSHNAIRAGLQHVNGKYVTCVSADLQDPLSIIENMYHKCLENDLDIIWAKRADYKRSLSQKTFSKIYWSMVKRFVDDKIPEHGYDVFLINDKVNTQLNLNIESNSSIHIQILSLGFKQDSIEYDKVERKHGKSKWTLNKKIKLLVDSFVAFSFAPIRLVTIVGITLFLGGLLFSFYLLIRKVLFHDLVSGWTMLMTTLSLGFGITNISLGIIAEYLWRTFDAARGRPAFIIDEIIDLKNE